MVLWVGEKPTNCNNLYVIPGNVHGLSCSFCALQFAHFVIFYASECCVVFVTFKRTLNVADELCNIYIFTVIIAPNGATVVPATSGHLRFGTKVAPRGKWPLVAGNGNS